MSVRDKKILVVFLGILVVVAAFFLGYRPLNEKKATLEAENASLRDTYADLSMKASNADMYTKEIKMMNTKMIRRTKISLWKVCLKIILDI